MNNEQENKNPEEITIITEEGNYNAEYLKNRKKNVGDYSENTVAEDKTTSTEYESDVLQHLESVTTLSIISKIFYGFSVLTIIGLFSYLSGITLANVEIMSIQFLIICSYFGSAFIFFSFGELFRVINRIDKKL